MLETPETGTGYKPASGFLVMFFSTKMFVTSNAPRRLQS